MIAILSKGRPKFAKKIQDKYKKVSQCPCYVFVETHDKHTYLDYGIDNLVEISTKGIGEARNSALKWIYDFGGFEKCIMSDDDVMPPENIDELMEALTDESPWVAGYFSFYGITGIKRNTGIWYVPNMGSKIYALDIPQILKLGNFDKDMYYVEDDELKIRMYKQGQYISLHTGVICRAMNSRFDEGGISTYADSANKFAYSVERMIQKHGEYFSRPPKRFRIQWKNMFKDGLLNIDYDKLPKQVI